MTDWAMERAMGGCGRCDPSLNVSGEPRPEGPCSRCRDTADKLRALAAEKDAEIERLQRQNRNLRQAVDEAEPDMQRLLRKVAHNATLVAALRPFLTHRDDDHECREWRDGPDTCDCGLAAILATTDSETP